MAYRYGQNYESSVHNIKGIIKTSKVHTIYQSCTKYIKLGNVISKCAHKISTTVTRSSNMKGSGSNQSEDCRHVTSKNGSRAMLSFAVVWQRFLSSFIGLTIFLLSSYDGTCKAYFDSAEFGTRRLDELGRTLYRFLSMLPYGELKNICISR